MIQIDQNIFFGVIANVLHFDPGLRSQQVLGEEGIDQDPLSQTFHLEPTTPAVTSGESPHRASKYFLQVCERSPERSQTQRKM